MAGNNGVLDWMQIHPMSKVSLILLLMILGFEEGIGNKETFVKCAVLKMTIS